MATPPIHEHSSNPHQIDRLSILPDELLVTILPFLPIRMAARTSILSRRFRHLCEAVWDTSPSLDLISRDFPYRKTSAARFVTMAERTFLSRSPSHPLPRLRLEFDRYLTFASSDSESSFLSSLYVKACSLGVRHLTIDSFRFSLVCPILPLIFSVNSLESLSLPSQEAFVGTSCFVLTPRQLLILVTYSLCLLHHASYASLFF